MQPNDSFRTFRTWLYTRLFRLDVLLILIWIITLRRNETFSFDRSVRSCHWKYWEDWPQNASPHHLVLLADPQLVDPHTYPGRPWPLSTLTVKHTDIYLKRTYSRILHDIDPYTIIFLGDLFDGGREWATEHSVSPERRYQQYGDSFWLNEYRRFNSIFLPKWDVREGSRRLIASLPGNHDLGFGNGIQQAVKDRFTAYFGESNRIDIIGNHTFVGLDTVSLSAKEQDSSENTKHVWGPPQDFLDAFPKTLDSTYRRHLDLTFNRTSVETVAIRTHEVEDASRAPIGIKHATPSRAAPNADLPTILLTHVPLYRPSGTPCGPHREKHPPSPPPPGQAEPLAVDERNSIPVYAGYQYQNVLTAQLSAAIIKKLGNKVEQVFSGDDHDYCEIVHRGYPSRGSGVKEITVKTLSWAMGVRRPGFLLVSLWNEIDEQGRSIRGGSGLSSTIQTRLCLLPDQLAVFIQYGIILGLSLLLLAIRAAFTTFIRPSDYRTSNTALLLLPRYSGAEQEKHLETERADAKKYDVDAYPNHVSTGSTSSSEDRSGSALLTRNAAANRALSSSPSKSGYAYGYAMTPSTLIPDYDQGGRHPFRKPGAASRSTKPRSKTVTFFIRWIRSVAVVGCFVLPYYVWLWNYR